MTVTARTHRPHHTAPARSRTSDPRAVAPLATALRIAADATLWGPALDYDPDRRYYRRLVADEHAEAWLLTWLPGQGTEWHDHGGSAGAFVVVQGTLVERTARHGIVRGPRRVHVRGGGDEFGPDYVHRVTNEGPDPAVSIHVYAPRLTIQRDYVAHDGILQLLGTRVAGADW